MGVRVWPLRLPAADQLDEYKQKARILASRLQVGRATMLPLVA